MKYSSNHTIAKLISLGIYDDKDSTNWVYAKVLAVLNDKDKQIKILEANNRDLVNRNRLLRQRSDLPVDRIPAHQEMVRLQEEVRSLEEREKNYLETIGEDTKTIKELRLEIALLTQNEKENPDSSCSNL